MIEDCRTNTMLEMLIGTYVSNAFIIIVKKWFVYRVQEGSVLINPWFAGHEEVKKAFIYFIAKPPPTKRVFVEFD